MSRIFRVGAFAGEAGKAEKALQSINVAVRDTAGEFRPLDNILKDIRDKWDNLTSVEQTFISQTLAGTYHINKFSALMNELETASEATTLALNSQGSALDENAKYLDSISGRLGVLRSSIEEAFARSISVDLIKGIVSSVTTLVNLFGDLKIVILAVVAALAIWKSQALTTMVITLASGVAALTQHFIVLHNTTGIVATEMFALSVSIDKLKASLVTFVKANWVGILLTAISALIIGVNAWKNSQEEAARKTEETTKKLTDQQKAMANATEYYRNNADKVESDAKVKQDLIAIEENLQNQFGETAKQLDLVNGKFEEQIELLENMNLEQLENALSDLEKLGDPRKQKFDISSFTSFKAYEDSPITEMPEQYNMGLDQYIEKLQKVRQTLRDTKDNIITWNNEVYDSEERINILKGKLNEEIKKARELQERSNTIEQTRIKILQNQVFTNKELNKTQIAVQDTLSKEVEYKSKEQYTKELEKIAKKVNDVKNLEEQFRKLDGQISTGEITWEKYNVEADKIKGTLKGIGLDEEAINSIFTFQTGLKQTVLSAEEFEDRLQAANDEYKAVTENIKLLDGALKELNDGQKLSADTTSELVRKFPQLTDKLNQTESAIEAISDVYNTLAKDANTTYKDLLSKDKQFYDAVIENNQDLIEKLKVQYQEDLRNAQSITEAKEMIKREIAVLEARKTILDVQKINADPSSQIFLRLHIESANVDKQLNELKNTAKGLDNTLEKTSDAVNFKEAVKQARDLEAEFDKIKSKAKMLASAIEELSEGNKLTFDAISELVEQYPELLSVLGDNVKLMEKLKELHGQEAEEAKIAFTAKLKANETFFKNLFQHNEAFFNGIKDAYGKDIKNYKEYLRIKKDMSSLATQIIGENWNEDIKGSIKQLETQIAQAREAGVPYIEESPMFKQLKELRGLLKAEGKVQDDFDKKIKSLLKGMNFDKIGFSDKQLNKNEKEKKDLKKETVDALMQEEAALKAVNNQIEKNNALQDQAEGTKRVALLNTEINLLKQKKTALSNLITALDQEKTKTKKSLAGLGVKFDAKGLMINIESVFQSAVNKVNKAADAGNEKAHESALKALENVRDLSDTYEALLLDRIPETRRELIAGTGRLLEIEKEKAEISIEGLDDKYKKLANSVKPVQKEIEKLNETLSDTSNENYERRKEITEELVDRNTKLKQTYSDIINQLKNMAIKYKDHKETYEIINGLIEDFTGNLEDAEKEANNLTKANNVLAKEMEETYKTKVYEEVEKVINAVNDEIEDQIELYEKAKDRYDDLADAELKAHYEKIDLLDEEIKGLQEKNDEIERSQELAKFDKDIKKQKEVLDNLKDERTLLIYREGRGWVWEVDERKIAEEQEKLEELEQDLADTKRDYEIEDKEIEKQVSEDKIKEIEDRYDALIRTTEKGLLDIADVIKEDNTINNAWDKLLVTMAETGNTFYTDEIGKLKTFVENAKKILKDSKLEENKENTKIKEDTEIKEDKKSKDTFERTYIAPPAETPIPTNQGGEDFTTPNIEEQSLKNKQKLDSLNKNKEEDTIAEMKKNSAQWLSSITLERKKELADKNLELGQKMGWNRTSTGIWLKPDGTKAYKKGGIVDYTGLAEVHGSETEPEAFLNSKQTELFSGLIKQLPNFNLNTIGQSSTGKTEIYDIKINEVKTNDASAFINNLKSLTYSKGRGR